MPGSERRRELRRRRKRKKQITLLKRKSEKASASGKQELADKVRQMTPGAKQIIANLGLEK